MSQEQFAELIELLSAPRPNGSRALVATVAAVRKWLEEAGIGVEAHPFTLRPYSMELLGLCMGMMGLLLPVAALGRWGWAGLVLALLTVAVPVLEVRFLVPTVTLLVRRRAHNLVVAFPAREPVREMILCAHLDSKTELLDHVQRGRLLRMSLPVMGLVLASGFLLAGEGLLPAGVAQDAARWLALLAALPVAVYGLAMAANLTGGRFSPNPSTGAVDDGAAVVVLLALARELHSGEPNLGHTSVTVLLTVGEEAQMQGALAYVRDREAWPLPASAVNLEVLGQNGGYLLWEFDGTALMRLAVDATLRDALARSIKAEKGLAAARADKIESDTFAFLRAGIPAATLGSYDREMGGRGYHSALDRPERVDPDRLAETVRLLSRFLAEIDEEQARTAWEK